MTRGAIVSVLRCLGAAAGWPVSPSRAGFARRERHARTPESCTHAPSRLPRFAGGPFPSRLRPVGLARVGRLAACLLAAVFALTLAAGAAEAQTSVKLVGNNVSGTRHDGNLVWDRAVAFTTGSHAHGYRLTRLDIRMRNGAATAPPYSVSIHSDSSGLPGANLGTLTNPSSLPTSNGWAEFTASGNGIDLAKDTKYWVVVDRTGGDGSNTFIRITTADCKFLAYLTAIPMGLDRDSYGI